MTALQNAQSARGGSLTICTPAGTALVFVGDLTASSFSAGVPVPGEYAVRRVPRHVPRVVGSMRRYAPALIEAGRPRRSTCLLAILIGCCSGALLLLAVCTDAGEAICP